MGIGLRALTRVAGLDVLDRLGLRRAAERAVRDAMRNGTRAGGAASRAFVAARRLGAPERLAPTQPAGLFDLTPTDEQQMLRDAFGDFARERLRPAAQAADAACRPPDDLLAQAAELGVAMLGVPAALGGAVDERSAVTTVLVAEALAHGDPGLAVALLAPGAVAGALAAWGDADQQSRYLPPFVGDDVPAAALALLEPHALADPLTPRTTARAAPGGGYVLDGVKSLVPLAATAELLVVSASLDGRPVLVLVESSGAGLTVAAEPAMGLRAAATGSLRLDGVTVGADALVGDGDPAVAAECVRRARLGWCAVAVGAAQAVLDHVVPYVNERRAFGEPISHRQAVAFAVSDVAIEVEGMRLATLRAASRADAGRPFHREAAIARRLCAEKGTAIGSQGVQLLGGHGYVKEHPVERWYRDLRAAGVMEGALLV
jgi:alkylation response protein AidB-like acyl-CoA dehydrogenase